MTRHRITCSFQRPAALSCAGLSSGRPGGDTGCGKPFLRRPEHRPGGRERPEGCRGGEADPAGPFINGKNGPSPLILCGIAAVWWLW